MSAFDPKRTSARLGKMAPSDQTGICRAYGSGWYRRLSSAEGSRCGYHIGWAEWARRKSPRCRPVFSKVAVSSESESKERAPHPAPVVASLGLRAAAAADLCASLAQLLSPVLDVLIRLWLAEGFLVTDVLAHMLPAGHAILRDHLSPSASLFA